MKHLFLFLTVFFLGTNLSAQNTAVFDAIKTLLISQHPELDLNNKLIAVNIWSVSDQNSRHANAAFEKTCTTYSKAKLNGGRKGLVVVILNKDGLDEYSVMALGKDGILCCQSYKLSDLKESLPVKTNNLVYNSSGELLFSNIPTDQIFSSIHSLITR